MVKHLPPKTTTDRNLYRCWCDSLCFFLFPRDFVEHCVQKHGSIAAHAIACGLGVKMRRYLCPICRAPFTSELLQYSHVYKEHLPAVDGERDRRRCVCGMIVWGYTNFHYHVKRKLSTTLIRHLLAAGLGVTNDKA